MKTLMLIISIFILTIMTLGATNRYVPAEYTTIQSALNASISGDSVIVAPGTYTEIIIWPQVDGIILKSSGNYLNTIIDANVAGRCIGFIGAWTNPVITQATVIDGFTLRRGYTAENGAGIMCYYSSPTIRNCIVAFNEAYSVGSGGGLYCYGSSPALTNVIFAYNIGYSGGGAHIDPLSSPIFNNCVFADNTLNSPGGSFAAGIYGRYQVNFQLNNCTVSRNRYGNRAAIHLGEVCTPIIQHSVISDNDYGILVVHDGGINLSNSNIINNTYAGLWHYDTDGDILNVQNNWWGAATGPYHDTNNPNGEGEIVIGLLDFSNWLTSMDSSAPASPPLTIYPESFEEGFVTVSWSINPETDIDYYEVNYGTNPLDVIFPNTLLVDGWSTTIPCTNPLYIQVAAVKANGEKSWYSQRIYWIPDSIDDQIITKPLIMSIFPNPFSKEVSLRYDLKESANHSLSVYNIKGELVKNLYQGYQKSGTQTISWNGKDNNNKSVVNGIYLVQSQLGNAISTKKVIKVQ
jgi:hypothetical protein